LSGHQRALSEIAAVAQKELADITRDGTDALKDLDDEIRLLESEISTLRSTSELYKRRDQLLDDLKVYRRRRLVAQQKLDDHKQGEKSRRLDFATIYHSVITWLYVNQRRGVMDLNTLVPDIHMSRYEAGHDSGAAALPIATVAFDLALLEYGLTFGQSEHPRLLVHDSPALFEIDPNVYARVFDWIIERESTLSDEDTFQYIITTIHLPERLRNVPDVIRKHLRGDTPDGKLLGLDY
jgi:hypothetical protein